MIKALYKKILKEFGIINYIKIIIFLKYYGLKLRFTNLTKSYRIKINGYDFYTVPNDKGISAELLMFGTHEPVTTQLLAKELKSGMVCLDIGANIGYYACLEANAVMEDGMVYAIEASPKNFQMLQKNVGLQKNSNIESFNFACGDEEGKVTFLTSDRSNWSKILDDDTIFEYKDKIIFEDNVEQKTIDSFINEKKINRIDLIRMDTEGYEYKILKGMKKTIAKFKPLISFELHRNVLGKEKTESILNFLKEQGYEVKYYIPRILDAPIVGSQKMVKNLMIDDILKKLNENILPGTILLFLENKKNNCFT